jgi:S-adenosylmethionine-diacylgycerolhomoserine-N-methlytransferase
MLQDLKTLYHIVTGPVGGATHADRLESFYGPQAEGYDRFRKRLLHGREMLFNALPVAPGQVWVDMGAGTGSSLDFMGARAASLGAIHLVDLSPSLLKVAERRVSEHKLANVSLHVADVTTFEPPGGPVDLVTFSYSLTMVPDWFGALERARAILKPGGHIGVVDFFVSRKYVAEGRACHGAFTRHFWPWWFSNDNVFLNADHVPYLERHFETKYREEHLGRLPFVPMARVPYYGFIGAVRR